MVIKLYGLDSLVNESTFRLEDDMIDLWEPNQARFRCQHIYISGKVIPRPTEDDLTS